MLLKTHILVSRKYIIRPLNKDHKNLAKYSQNCPRKQCLHKFYVRPSEARYRTIRFTIDGFAKSRHSGENRSPETLQLIEKTGFSDKSESLTGWSLSRKRCGAGMTKNGVFRLFTSSSILTNINLGFSFNNQ